MSDQKTGTGPAETATRPSPRAMEASAAAYLGELQSAAELVLHRRAETELAERGSWLHLPADARRGADTGEGSALNSPLTQADQYAFLRLSAAARAARQDVGRVAWWYTTAALAALDAVLAGQEITGRRLEILTMNNPDREVPPDDALPWDRCFRPRLPGDGELRTGIERIDSAMDAALAPLRSAYAAAAAAEDYYRLQNEPADGYDGEPATLTDAELRELDDAETEAPTIPGLLIDYARTVEAAAFAAARA